MPKSQLPDGWVTVATVRSKEAGAIVSVPVYMSPQMKERVASNVNPERLPIFSS